MSGQGASKLQPIRYSRGSLELLDQTKLPLEEHYDVIKTTQDGWDAIREMKVRGAPAIAVSGALSVAAEAWNVHSEKLSDVDAAAVSAWILERLESLKSSRPTAVNLFQAIEELSSVTTKALGAEGATSKGVLEAFVDAAEAMLEADVKGNKAMGSNGADLFLARESSRPLRVMTHCNTGSLATAGYGTALGVIRALQERNAIDRVYCTETRPYNQGARLTAYELVAEGINSCLITDSMAAWLMKKEGPIDGIVVGADRIAANGDTANKIGTYALAVLAKHHNVPFYVIAPWSTIDLNIPSGEFIPIEERAGTEITHFRGVQVTPDIPVWNPAFDVTPSSLISAIVTETGVVLPGPDGSFNLAASSPSAQ